MLSVGIPSLAQTGLQLTAAPVNLSFDLAIPELPFQSLPNLSSFIDLSTTDTPDIPSPYSYHDLGVFCKLEVQMDKKTKFPIRLRLGEFHYTEKLEGKRPIEVQR